MTTTTHHTRSASSRRRPPSAAVMQLAVNPVVSRILRSPVHDLLSRHVALVEATGRRSGRHRATPVDFAWRDGELRLTSRPERQWWRNLRANPRVVIWLAGRPHAGTARVVAPEAGVVVVQIALSPPPAPDPPLLGAALVRRWIVACTAGELVGFTVPAVAGALTAATTPPALAVLLLLVAAGIFEGAILGFAQAVALRRALPGVRTVSWIRATAVGAGLAWAAGMVPSTLGDRLDDVPVAAVVAAAVPLGLMMLLGIGVLQARCLRGHVARPWRWVAASAAAWMAGLGAGGLVWTRWAEGQPLALVIAIGIAGAAVMALVMAAISGAALARLAREAQVGVLTSVEVRRAQGARPRPAT